MKKLLALILSATLLTSTIFLNVQAKDRNPSETYLNIFTPKEAEVAKLPAFPGAEGGGKYTTGGRGGTVYYVTNLNDSGEGSLRDAVSAPNRTILFNVSGTIFLQSPLALKQPNITIAGQTAPGDGICIANYMTQIDADNIIIRYLRFRTGSGAKAENDALWARGHQFIMIDHCSASWSTDETISVYGVANTTVQWCIASESLTLSAHAKGRHGYGGIWGGTNTTFHHNLIATHTSRMPRYLNSTTNHPDYLDESSNDMVNNVFYNWGFNSGYGAENDTRLNIENNYYKPGPLTNDNVANRIFNPSNEGCFYVAGNFMYNNFEVTADNAKGIQPAPNANPTMYTNPYTIGLIRLNQMQTAEAAYDAVLRNVGATLPKRDAYDAKIVNDVKNGTGRAINHESEVGGYPELKSSPSRSDADLDGLPDTWELQYPDLLNKFDGTDANVVARSGYTNLEDYLNNFVSAAPAPSNPDVTIDSLQSDCIYLYNQPINIVATATAKNGKRITAVKFYKNDKMIGQGTSDPYTFTTTATEDGTWYLTAKATDSEGLETTSSVKVIHVNSTGKIAPWTSLDIGKTTLPGHASFENGLYTVKSAGRIGPEKERGLSEKEDSFQFMYQTIGTNADISAKLESVSKLNNNCVTGLMMRNSLDTASDFVLVNYEYEKNGAGLSFTYRKDGKYTRKFVKAETLPVYMRLQKNRDEITAYQSQDGISWALLGQITVNFDNHIQFAGIAVDGNKEYNKINNYTIGKFSNLVLHDYKEATIPTVTLVAKKNAVSVSEPVVLNVDAKDMDGIEKVELYKNGEKIETIDTPSTAYTVGTLPTGSYWFTAKAYSKDGGVGTTSINVGVSKLDAAYSLAEIGTMPLRAAAQREGDKVTLYGSGFGVEPSVAEQTPFLYTQRAGDDGISVKIDGQQLAEYEHMGIMVRTSLDENSKGYVLYFQPYNGLYFASSAKKGTPYTIIKQQKYKKTPVWLTLEKSGKLLKASYSEDGITYKPVGEVAVDFDHFYVGLFASTTEEYHIHDVHFSSLQFTKK